MPCWKFEKRRRRPAVRPRGSIGASSRCPPFKFLVARNIEAALREVNAFFMLHLRCGPAPARACLPCQRERLAWRQQQMSVMLTNHQRGENNESRKPVLANACNTGGPAWRHQ